MKVLCICPIGIGNYLLFYPACAMLKECRPDLELHLLALRNSIADFASGDPLWSVIHVMDPTRVRSFSKKSAFIAMLGRQKFQASLSFFPSNRFEYNLLPFLCRIKERFAFKYVLHGMRAFSFLNNRLIPVDIAKHDLHQNIGMVSVFLAQDLHDRKMTFPKLFTEKETAAVNTMLGETGKRRIAIHAGSSAEHGMDAKRWAPENFGLLADRICQKLDAEALILGGPEEADLKAAVASVMKQPHRIIDPVNLNLTSAMLAGCKLCLCNDSGIMHMAAVTGTPVAAVFGPTDERRNGPVGNGHLILRKEMPGFPLWTARNVGVRYIPEGVDPNASIKTLSVDDAWGMVEPWLDKIV